MNRGSNAFITGENSGSGLVQLFRIKQEYPESRGLERSVGLHLRLERGD
jgi:hypothetical protein